MSRPARGLYQSLVTEALKAGLDELEPTLRARFADLHHSDVADRLAVHLARVIQRVIAAIEEDQRVKGGVELTRELIIQAIKAVAPEALTLLSNARPFPDNS